ncbi:MAG: thioredoxin domain-containing protein [Bacteroidia bacterium]
MAKGINNLLERETSPYLLQHANNPVNWQAWNKSALEVAEIENKLVIVSIGYSACHWCHVMEHESFEDEAVAKFMNENFVSIKVDREERPDIDNLYMTAVQLMTGHGGWPLNCICLPDGRPVYGGTYFTRSQWLQVLNDLIRLKNENPSKIFEYAESLQHGIQRSEEIITSVSNEEKSLEKNIKAGINKWELQFDMDNGGFNRVPKFPMPNNYMYLLRYGYVFKKQEILDHVQFTLLKMCNGGMYDQLHGGFARYSTDGLWKLPHFEKMLYDNAQLLSLYCEAYRLFENNRFLTVIEETLNFILDEWFHPHGYFYSAYDADSEGEEGKYYVWQMDELESVIKDDFELFKEVFQVNNKGYWEEANYILMRHENISDLLIKYDLTTKELDNKINSFKNLLKKVADKRVKPLLDKKSICSWNGLMIKALVDAYNCTLNPKYKEVALKCGEFLIDKRIKNGNELFRNYVSNESVINGFLDDYAFSIEALIALYSLEGNNLFVQKAESLTAYVLNKFSNQSSPYLYYTNSDYHELINRQTEMSDNVIPSSNSQMAVNLFLLGKITGKSKYTELAEKMLNPQLENIAEYPSGYSNWANLALMKLGPFRELVIVGNHVDEFMKELGNHYFTNTILVGSKSGGNDPLLNGRFQQDKTLIYLCENNTCLSPFEKVSDLLNYFEKD